MSTDDFYRSGNIFDTQRTASRIVSGAVASGGSGAMGAASYTGADVESAMSAAITAAHAEGITDPVKVRERMMAARKKITTGSTP